MPDFTLKTPTIRVPGLLSDEAMQEQLKQFKASGVNGGASQAPSSAVEMAGRVQSEFFDNPVRSAIKAAAPLAGPLSPVVATAARLAPDVLSSAPAPVDPQQRAIDVRSDILSDDSVSAVSSFYLGGGAGVLAREGGLLDAAGTLTPEESTQQQQERVQEARDAEATVQRHVSVRDQLRNLTDDQAGALGMPIAPGTDAQTNKEVREIEQSRDTARAERAAKDTATAEAAPAPVKAWWLDAIRSFSRAQTEGYTAIGKGAVIALRELPFTAFGAATGGETERSDMRAWFDTVDATMAKLLPPDRARDQDFMRTLTAGAGSMTSFLTASTVAGALGLPAKVATMITGAATGATQQFEDAEKHDGTELQKLVAFFAGSALGSSEALPINRMLGRAERATGGLVTRMLRQSTAGSLEEFVQELGQNVGQDLVAKWTYDEQRQMDPQAYLKAGAAGAILGGIGGTATTVMERNGILPRGEDAPLEDNQAVAQREARQQEQLTQVIAATQQQFDALTAETVQPTTSETIAPLPAEVVEPLVAPVVEPVTGVALADVVEPTVTGTAPVPTVEEFKAAVATGAPLRSLPSSVSLVTPPAPTKEQMDASSRVQDVPLSAARSTQSVMEWDKFNAGQYGETLVEGYADMPVAVRREDGEFLVFDGHHRTVQAMNAGQTTMPMHVIDAKTYAPEAAGRAPTKDDTDTDALLAELLASTSTTRGTYRAEPQRGVQTPGATDPAADNVNLRRIGNNFTKLLGLTVRQGRFTLKGADVMGQFSTRSGVIRLRTPSDISTLIHEGGHALEQGADGELRNFITAHKTELDAAARSLYAGDLSKLPANAVTSEGFAEFFRVFVTNRLYADANFATLSSDFATLLDRHNPQMRDGLKLIGDQYAAWLQLPSAQLIRNMIQTGKETTGINAKIAEAREQGLVNWFREWANGIFSSAINQNNNLNMLVADILNTAEAQSNRVIDLKRADDPRVLIRLATNSGNRAMVQMTDGIMPHRSTTPASAGLRDVLLRYHGLDSDKQLSAIDPGRQADFAAYVVSLRGIDEYRRWSQGIIDRAPLAATLGDLTTTVNEMETKYGQDFQQAAQMLHDYSMALWEKSYQAGLIDDKTYQDGNTRQFYVPLQRDMSDKDSSQSGIAASAVARGGSVVKRFRGSDRDIIDPMDALMQKTFAIEKVIAENEVKVALAKLADKAGTVGSLVERIPASKLLGQQYGVEEVARQLAKDPSMSPADAADLMTLLDAAIDDGNRIALFRSQQVAAAGENVVFFWEKGKLAALQIKDGDIGADIINTLNAVGTETVPLLTELIAYPSTVFRAAVTSWPDFLLVNFIRDQMSAFVLTEGYTPFVTGLRGVSDEIRQHTWAREYNAAMGTMGGMNSSTLHDARVKRDIASLRKKGYLARVWRDKSPAGAVKGLARITELTETGTRLGIYRSAYDRGIADGLTQWEASVEASYLSTDYIDFGLHGNRMLAWRRMIPFLNAQLQGLNKMVRTLAGDEVRQRKGLMFAVSAFFKDTRGLQLSRAEQQAVRTGRKAWLKMASLGIIGAAINAIFQDDPDYQDASEYLRTTGWVIPIGDGQIFYIPKPFELAMVSNIVERGMEMASGDKEAKNRLLRGMAMNLLPPTNPPAIQALVEQLANWQSFSGGEIVPDYMRALEPELQYNHYTSEFAKSLGKALGWSPMRIDHAFSALGASAYRDLNALYNASDPSRPQSDITDWPMTRRFVRDARRGSVSAQDFWKFASTVTGSLRRAETSYKSYIEAGQERAAENYLDELEPDERAYAILNTHFKSDYKKLNPVYRTRQLTTIVSAMRRELYSDLGVENTMKGFEEEPLMLSAKEKADVDNLLSEYARREVRNQLVFMKAPGWATKKPLPTEPTIELLRTTNPMVAEEFERRVKKAKVYSAETVQEYWPEVRDRLLQDRDEAFLKDIQTVAKAMR